MRNTSSGHGGLKLQRLRLRFHALRGVMYGLMVFGSICLAAKCQAKGLAPYTCLTRYYDTDKWLETGDRRLDADGILQQQGQYFPLSIAFFGIMRYEDFLRGGDSAHYRDMVAQYRYFSNPKVAISKFGGHGLGFPYHQDFKDMKAPWLSGMTQGVAISYLLRYVDLTGDTTALPLIHQAAFLLMMPIQIGGTMGCNPEGEWWIEEYPNSERSPQVMNGFINALIGLREYCDRFPENKVAAAMHTACYASMVHSFHHYDYARGTRYDRREFSFIPISYLRYQIQQMEHLTDLYGDRRLAQQWQLWARHAMGRPDQKTHYYRAPAHQTMEVMHQVSDGEGWRHRIAFDSLCVPLVAQLGEGGIAGKTVQFPLELHGAAQLHLPSPQHYLRIGLADEMQAKLLAVKALDDAGGEVKTRLQVVGRFVEVFAVQRPASSIALSAQDGSELLVSSLEHFDAATLRAPRFLMLKLSGPVPLSRGCSYQVQPLSQNITELALYYRYSPKFTAVKDSIWRFEHAMPLPNAGFMPPADGYYEGYVVFPLLLPFPRLVRVELVAE